VYFNVAAQICLWKGSIFVAIERSSRYRNSCLLCSSRVKRDSALSYKFCPKSATENQSWQVSRAGKVKNRHKVVVLSESVHFYYAVYRNHMFGGARALLPPDCGVRRARSEKERKPATKRKQEVRGSWGRRGWWRQGRQDGTGRKQAKEMCVTFKLQKYASFIMLYLFYFSQPLSNCHVRICHRRFIYALYCVWQTVCCDRMFAAMAKVEELCSSSRRFQPSLPFQFQERRLHRVPDQEWNVLHGVRVRPEERRQRRHLRPGIRNLLHMWD
jgi:hypothetical protein